MKGIGNLDVICGGMFSGKTTEFLRKLEREVLAKKKVKVFKPIINDRDGENTVTDRNKYLKMEAINLPLHYDAEVVQHIYEQVKEVDIVGIDEVQFFDPWIRDVCVQLRKQGKKVIVAGLDMDYKAEPFGSVGYLMAISNNTTKLHAVCMVCGEDAVFNQRLLHGKPAPHEGDKPVIGDNKKYKKSKYTYQARCLCCYVHPNEVTSE